MITLEFIISIYTIIALTVSIILVWNDIIKSPVLETKLLLVTTCIVWLAVFLSIFAGAFSSTSSISSTSQFLAKLELGLIGPFYIFMTFAFMLPNFRLSYFHIFQLSIIVAVNSALSFYLYSSTKLISTTSAGYLRYTLPLGAGLVFALSTLIFLYYFYHRLYEVKDLREQKENTYISVREMIIIVTIALFSVFTILTSFEFQDFDNFLELELPGHIFLVPFSFVFMISAYLIHKDTAYPFAVPIKLYGIIITERETGLTILSKDYQSEIPTIDLLGNLFSALDISLQDTIKSTKTIEDIVFGDKVVHIASGQLISSIMIVSRNSLITKTLTRYITREFESRYSHEFDPMKPVNVSNFRNFEEVFHEIRRYLAL